MGQVREGWLQRAQPGQHSGTGTQGCQGRLVTDLKASRRMREEVHEDPRLLASPSPTLIQRPVGYSEKRDGACAWTCASALWTRVCMCVGRVGCQMDEGG